MSLYWARFYCVIGDTAFSVAFALLTGCATVPDRVQIIESNQWPAKLGATDGVLER